MSVVFFKFDRQQDLDPELFNGLAGHRIARSLHGVLAGRATGYGLEFRASQFAHRRVCLAHEPAGIIRHCGLLGVDGRTLAT